MPAASRPASPSVTVPSVRRPSRNAAPHAHPAAGYAPRASPTPPPSSPKTRRERGPSWVQSTQLRRSMLRASSSAALRPRGSRASRGRRGGRLEGVWSPGSPLSSTGTTPPRFSVCGSAGWATDGQESRGAHVARRRPLPRCEPRGAHRPLRSTHAGLADPRHRPRPSRGTPAVAPRARRRASMVRVERERAMRGIGFRSPLPSAPQGPRSGTDASCAAARFATTATREGAPLSSRERRARGGGSPPKFQTQSANISRRSRLATRARARPGPSCAERRRPNNGARRLAALLVRRERASVDAPSVSARRRSGGWSARRGVRAWWRRRPAARWASTGTGTRTA